MKAIGKIILGVALAGSTLFASCDGSGDQTAKDMTSDSTLIAYKYLLKNGQSFDKDGNIIDQDGTVVKTYDEVQSMAANQPNANQDNATQQDAGPLTEKDFLFAVIETNTKQIAVLEAGTKNCTNQDMLQASKDMLKQHEELRNEVNTFAQVHGYGLPDLSEEENASVDASAGMAWDNAFAKKVASLDNDLIGLFERGKQSVGNKDLQVVITNFMPTLQSNKASADSWTAAM